MSQQQLLRNAKDERDIWPGYLTDNTRARLEDIGMTAAQIESALTHMENSNG